MMLAAVVDQKAMGNMATQCHLKIHMTQNLGVLVQIELTNVDHAADLIHLRAPYYDPQSIEVGIRPVSPDGSGGMEWILGYHPGTVHEEGELRNAIGMGGHVGYREYPAKEYRKLATTEPCLLELGISEKNVVLYLNRELYVDEKLAGEEELRINEMFGEVRTGRTWCKPTWLHRDWRTRNFAKDVHDYLLEGTVRYMLAGRTEQVPRSIQTDIESWVVTLHIVAPELYEVHRVKRQPSQPNQQTPETRRIEVGKSYLAVEQELEGWAQHVVTGFNNNGRSRAGQVLSGPALLAIRPLTVTRARTPTKKKSKTVSTHRKVFALNRVPLEYNAIPIETGPTLRMAVEEENLPEKIQLVLQVLVLNSTSTNTISDIVDEETRGGILPPWRNSDARSSG